MDHLDKKTITNTQCFACLSEGGKENVFSVTYRNVTMGYIFNLCTTIQLTENEMETKLLCEECFAFLKTFFDFKERALESYRIISQHMGYSETEPGTLNENVFKNESPVEVLSDGDIVILIDNHSVHSDDEDERSIEFEECSKEKNLFKNQKSLLKLNKQLKLENKWQCGYCNVTFSTLNPQEIKDHKYMEKQNRIKVHDCNVCGKKFDANGLKRHMTTHSAEKLVTCELCGKGLSSNYHLKKHMMLHTGKPHVCEVCNKGFTEKFLLKVHMNEHEKKESFICSTCGKVFLTTIQLSAHAFQHSYKKKDEEVGKISLFTCEICGKTFSCKVNLEVHLANHQKSKLYSCPYCDKKYSHQRQQKVHILEHEMRYRCKQCFKIFKRIDLKVHKCCPDVDKHFNDYLPNECKICGKILSRTDNMTKHLRKHSLRECQFCGEKFLNARRFRFHLNSHKLRCTLCNKGFAKKVSLELHIENQTCVKAKSKKNII